MDKFFFTDIKSRAYLRLNMLLEFEILPFNMRKKSKMLIVDHFEMLDLFFLQMLDRFFELWDRFFEMWDRFFKM